MNPDGYEESSNGSTMDNRLPVHRAADGDPNGPFTIGYYERATGMAFPC